MYRELDDGRHTSLDRVFLLMKLNLLTYVEWLYMLCFRISQINDSRLLYGFRYQKL